jgi:hypothetical protein
MSLLSGIVVLAFEDCRDISVCLWIYDSEQTREKSCDSELLYVPQGIEGKDILHIAAAYRKGLGEIDREKLTVLKLEC